LGAFSPTFNSAAQAKGALHNKTKKTTAKAFFI
jgi:hypothetical protein